MNGTDSIANHKRTAVASVPQRGTHEAPATEGLVMVASELAGGGRARKRKCGLEGSHSH